MPSAPDGWVTDNSGDQGVWTNVRPVYDPNYPALYIATQHESMNNTISCT